MSTPPERTTAKRNKWIAVILTILVIVPFTLSAIMKLTRGPEVVAGFTKLGIPTEAIVPLGLVELGCLALYLIPPTAVLGAFMLTGYLGGATLANVISGGDLIHVFAIGLLVWAGVWFRVPELQSLMPIRRLRSLPQP